MNIERIFIIVLILVSRYSIASATCIQCHNAGRDSLLSFYIIDTIEIETPVLLYFNERQNSMDKFTPIVLANKTYESIDFSKVRKAEQLLQNNKCFIFQSYSMLLSTLTLLGKTDATFLNQESPVQLKTDSCKAISNCISRCNLLGLKKSTFIIAIERTDAYNYYRVLEHKKIDSYFQFVLIAYPLQ